MNTGLETNWPRYQPGGDIYKRIANDHGATVAAAAAAAARDQDEATLLEILAKAGRVRISPGTTERDDSVASIFTGRIISDPLAAPLDSANDQIGKALWNVVRNPFVLLAVAAVVFYYAGGFGWLKRWLASK